ncbi:MAG: AAA family ATPase [Frankiaceae bacterium]
MLVVMAGLPGTGKTSLARAIGVALPAPVLSVDSIERAIRLAGVGDAEPVGLAAYAVAQALADEELRAGHPVVADAVNVAEEARRAWQQLAEAHGVPLVVVAMRCSDERAHRDRVESRAAGESGMPAMTWERVQELAAQQRPWPVPGLLSLDSCEELEGNIRLTLERIWAG